MAPHALTVLPGAPALLAAHARERPQRDELCGAFCGALALQAAGFTARGGEPLDQDTVARAAGTVLARDPDPSHLPPGAHGRRDYRVELPRVADSALSGTTAAGLVDALEALADGSLAALPFSGPWSAAALGGLFDALAACARPASAIANLATGHLWGSRAEVAAVLGHLTDGGDEGPPPDWAVGHFVCVFARLRGPGGEVYAVADTYPALGAGGVHLQPAARLAMALARPAGPGGGVVAVVAVGDAAAVRAAAAGLEEGAWDNGTVAVGGITYPPTQSATAAALRASPRSAWERGT